MGDGQRRAAAPSSERRVLRRALRDDLAREDLRWQTDQVSEVPADPLRCPARGFLCRVTISEEADRHYHPIPSVHEVVGLEPGRLPGLGDKAALGSPSVEFLLDRRGTGPRVSCDPAHELGDGAGLDPVVTTNGDVHEHLRAQQRVIALSHQPLPRPSKPAGLAPHPQRTCPAPDLLYTRPRFIAPRSTPRGNRFARKGHPPGDPIGQLPPRTARPSFATCRYPRLVQGTGYMRLSVSPTAPWTGARPATFAEPMSDATGATPAR